MGAARHSSDWSLRRDLFLPHDSGQGSHQLFRQLLSPFFCAAQDTRARFSRSKENRCGRSPVSNISNNEHTAASLGHSEVLSVKDSVREPIPEFDQRSEEGTKVPSFVR
jgi:hypothetical protein